MLYIAEFLVEKLGLYGAWGAVIAVSVLVMWYFGRRKKNKDSGE